MRSVIQPHPNRSASLISFARKTFDELKQLKIMFLWSTVHFFDENKMHESNPEDIVPWCASSLCISIKNRTVSNVHMLRAKLCSCVIVYICFVFACHSFSVVFMAFYFFYSNGVYWQQKLEGFSGFLLHPPSLFPSDEPLFS